jgi:hypothetical protein
MTINELLVALRQPIPEVYLSIKTSDRERIAYLPWYKATLLADDRLGGAWSHELVEHWIDNAARGSKNKGYVSTALAHCRVRVTIHGSDRDISREAIGVDDEPNGQRGTPLERAEAAGLRRALAKFGLGLELYNKDRAHAVPADDQRQTRYQQDQNRRAAAARTAPPPLPHPPAEHWPTAAAGPAAMSEDEARQVEDLLVAFEGATTETELAKLGQGLKGAPLAVQERVRTPYGVRLEEIRTGGTSAGTSAPPAPPRQRAQARNPNRRVIPRDVPVYAN